MIIISLACHYNEEDMKRGIIYWVHGYHYVQDGRGVTTQSAAGAHVENATFCLD